MRCLCENSEAKLDCNMCPARIGDTPSIKARARAMDSKWIRWGRRCIFKCSRRKPPQHRSSPPKLLIQFTAWVCALLFFESVYCRPPACLFQGIYLNGFRTKTRLFRDKGFYRLAPHDDFYWRRRHRLTGDGGRGTLGNVVTFIWWNFRWTPCCACHFGPDSSLLFLALFLVSLSSLSMVTRRPEGRYTPKSVWEQFCDKDNGNLPRPVHYYFK